MMGFSGAFGLFTSIVFHELWHSLVARRYGLPMKGITLFIFGGIAEMEEESVSPKTEALMAAAGPAASVAAGIVFWGASAAVYYAAWPVPVFAVFQYLALINLLLAAFNLLPGFSCLEALSIAARLGLDTPFIILSGSIGERMAVEAMRAGARDYVMKKNLTRLFPVIQREVKEARERAAMRRLEAQMIQAQKMDSIGRLAGGVAHDFNNMLTAILGISQVAASELPADHPVRKDIEEIEKTAKRATNLTRQLLAFSRKQIFEPRVIDLNDLLLNIENLLRRMLGEDIELVILPGSNLGLVKVDVSQFEQVILNLAVNARDAMPSGGKLMIETSNFEPDDGFSASYPEIMPGKSYVVLSVTDNGGGMSEEVRARLFEPFFTTKPKGQGTGLGLATSYGIVRQSGGLITVYSRPGQGTVFQIYLSRTTEEAPSGPVAQESGTDLNGTETILLVEDEPSVRKLALRILKQFGYSVFEAENGEEALRLWKKIKTARYIS